LVAIARGHHLKSEIQKYRWPHPTRELAHFILTPEDGIDLLAHSIDNSYHRGPTLGNSHQQGLYAIAGRRIN
jgi:hypothetical protein